MVLLVRNNEEWAKSGSSMKWQRSRWHLLQAVVAIRTHKGLTFRTVLPVSLTRLRPISSRLLVLVSHISQSRESRMGADSTFSPELHCDTDIGPCSEDYKPHSTTTVPDNYKCHPLPVATGLLAANTCLCKQCTQGLRHTLCWPWCTGRC